MLGGRLWLLVLQLLTDMAHSPDAKHREGAQTGGRGCSGGISSRRRPAYRAGCTDMSIPALAGLSIADSAYLLECLIGAAPRLIIPYVSPPSICSNKWRQAGAGSGAAAVMLGGPRGAQINHVGPVMAAGVSVQRKREGRQGPPVQQRRCWVAQGELRSITLGLSWLLG